MYQRDGKTFKLGTLCVIDATPRDVSSEELSLLETMAKLVIAEIEIREKNLKPAPNRSVKVHLFPRRKAGDQVFPEKGRLPVKVDRETIESMYGVPQVCHLSSVFPTALLPSSQRSWTECDHHLAPHRILSHARTTHLSRAVLSAAAGCSASARHIAHVAEASVPKAGRFKMAIPTPQLLARQHGR